MNDVQPPLPEPDEVEPVTEDQVAALYRCFTPIERRVMFDGEVDVSVGRGVFGGRGHNCLWMTNGHRLTVDIGGHGLIAALSKAPDPYYRRLKEESK